MSGCEEAVASTMPMLQLSAVFAGYGKKEILRGVDLTVTAGELVVVVGPNGAGKSTLLKVAAGLLIPSRGMVLLRGRDMTQLPPQERVRMGVGCLLQGGRVFPSLSVGENIELAASVLPSSARRASRQMVLETFPGLSRLLEHRAGLLSGGERQTTALAMALVRKPGLLLLDEPSAGLAPGLARDMLDTVRRLAEHWALAVLMVEQNVREALRVAHRAYALAEGRNAMETDKPIEWLASSVLEALFLGRPKESEQNSS